MIDSDKHKEDNIDNDTDSNGYDSNEMTEIMAKII